MTQTTSILRRIVVGVDPSENALRAAEWAARQATDLMLPLHLVHALDLSPGPGSVIETSGLAEARREDGEQLLARVADRVTQRYPDVLIYNEISRLSAPEALVGYSGPTTLMVTGTRGHGGFAGLLLGSVSLKLAAHARGTVVVVRDEQPTQPYNEIVLGVEPGQAEAPMRFAFAAAAQFSAALTVVRAWWPHPAFTGYYGEDRELNDRDQTAEAQTLIKGLQEEYPQVDANAAAMRGNAVPMLIEAARGSRLLVIGAHRQRSPLSVGAGYVVQGLLSHSPTPVAVVPIA
jgi:nucleotide-binding universal stress UspA family protein